MKKILVFLVAFLMAFSFVLAVNGAGAGQISAGVGSQSGQGGSGVQVNSETQTQNQGEESQLQVQTQVQAGAYLNEDGEQMQIQEQSQNRVMLNVGGVEAGSSLNMTQEKVQNRTKLQVKLSNGVNAEVKVMPNTASEKAIERLQLKVCNSSNGCSIELKEVGSGNQTRVAYEVQAQKEVKVLGLFRAKMNVQAEVDAETGEVIRTRKAWWAFLAKE